ncbi:hypothetical protein Droror1_Dr00019450 [Drosera rotundifolia]
MEYQMNHRLSTILSSTTSCTEPEVYSDLAHDECYQQYAAELIRFLGLGDHREEENNNKYDDDDDQEIRDNKEESSSDSEEALALREVNKSLKNLMKMFKNDNDPAEENDDEDSDEEEGSSLDDKAVSGETVYEVLQEIYDLLGVLLEQIEAEKAQAKKDTPRKHVEQQIKTKDKND